MHEHDMTKVMSFRPTRDLSGRCGRAVSSCIAPKFIRCFLKMCASFVPEADAIAPPALAQSTNPQCAAPIPRRDMNSCSGEARFSKLLPFKALHRAKAQGRLSRLEDTMLRQRQLRGPLASFCWSLKTAVIRQLQLPLCQIIEEKRASLNRELVAGTLRIASWARNWVIHQKFTSEM